MGIPSVACRASISSFEYIGQFIGSTHVVKKPMFSI
jgi:hypothetical protein